MGYSFDTVSVWYYRLDRTNKVINVMRGDFRQLRFYNGRVYVKYDKKTDKESRQSSYSASSKEGQIFNGGLWLTDRDDYKAAKIFADSVKERVEDFVSKAKREESILTKIMETDCILL